MYKNLTQFMASDFPRTCLSQAHVMIMKFVKYDYVFTTQLLPLFIVKTICYSKFDNSEMPKWPKQAQLSVSVFITGLY